ncbi:DNA cytosine methyltransferase [Roseateles sp. SL47]|uniref:DNA cytosine methyltransferase n=1 Tax=Roseateles sp. SL47 TaxID=2995138 RepID=UPI00227110D8|nr:DNA cytosine methyltransferase [Roseateles sp. SL47]WAC72084.1 DNA cytosine methyltransferase [Roseateles sp. SL47]
MRRDAFTMPLDLGRELIIDNFAGGGGTSTGLEQAFGRPVDIAINHDPEALAMHAMNHPHTLHLCESVWDVDPIQVTRNQPVALVWLSPDCKHFSKAKGGTPVKKEIRGLAWVGIRWVLLCKPRVLMLENVEEFTTWGPLMQLPDGSYRPDPSRAGETFEAFCAMLSKGIRRDHPAFEEACEFLEIDPDGEMATQLLRGLGYNVDYRELRACDYEAPTIRKRLFLIARRDGLPIVWPEATHGDPTSAAVQAGKLSPWRTAAECIDFSLPARSVFGRERELAENTQRRVAKGLWRHVLTSASPFIVGVGGRMGQSSARSVTQPTQTITAKADSCLAMPVLTPFIGDQSRPAEGKTSGADEPLRTQCAQVKGGHFTLVAPALTPMRGTSSGHMGGHSVAAPLSTVSAGGTHHALAGAHLVTIGYGERPGQDARTQDIRQPLGTVVAGGVKQGVVAAHLVDMGHGEGVDGTKRFSHGVRSLEVPLNTVTASGATSALAAVHLTHLTHHGERSGYGADEPFKTITGANRGEQALVSACMEQANGGFYDGDGRPVDAPMSTITAAGSNQRLITAYAVKYYSSGGQWQTLDDPMHTLPTKGRMGLVQTMQVPAACLAPEHADRARECAELLHRYLPENFPDPAEMVLVFQQGQWWVLVDITLRMLKPRELFNAQGFPADYVIEEIPDPEKLFVDGVQAANPLQVPRIPLTATAQVRMCGNSVSPPQAKALVLANFAHEVAIYGEAA